MHTHWHSQKHYGPPLPLATDNYQIIYCLTQRVDEIFFFTNYLLHHHPPLLPSCKANLWAPKGIHPVFMFTLTLWLSNVLQLTLTKSLLIFHCFITHQPVWHRLSAWPKRRHLLSLTTINKSAKLQTGATAAIKILLGSIDVYLNWDNTKNVTCKAMQELICIQVIQLLSNLQTLFLVGLLTRMWIAWQNLMSFV